MLWTLIYDFFVQYIFGGFDSNGSQFSASLGDMFIKEDEDFGGILTSDISFFQFKSLDGTYTYYMSMGNYFSFIATIITMVVIVLICCHFIKKVYNIFAHVIA